MNLEYLTSEDFYMDYPVESVCFSTILLYFFPEEDIRLTGVETRPQLISFNETIAWSTNLLIIGY